MQRNKYFFFNSFFYGKKMICIFFGSCLNCKVNLIIIRVPYIAAITTLDIGLPQRLAGLDAKSDTK